MTMQIIPTSPPEIKADRTERPLPYITPLERRYLHFGGDPGTVYLGNDLINFHKVKAKEEAA
jgi:hypothetical protein